MVTTVGDNGAVFLNLKEEHYENEDLNPLRCWDCNINFTNKTYLHDHLFHHIKQPNVLLNRIELPPLKITIKSNHNNSFQIVSSPSCSPTSSDRTTSKLADNTEPKQEKEDGSEGALDEETSKDSEKVLNDEKTEACFEDAVEEATIEEIVDDDDDDDDNNVATTNFSPNLVDGISEDAVATKSPQENTLEDYGSIPGAEPTPPPESSPDYPKIRIKTTGLLQEQPLTITEITDDNPNGEPNKDVKNRLDNNIWAEDPLKITENDNNILSLFNNNERAKDLGFTTSDSEFISLDRLDDRNRNALQLYGPATVSQNNALSSLTGLPMEALAQQVSRLQPSGSGMHQQNVLINIQQFPQAPPPQPPPYQPPPMYHHAQPIYQPYQYQPPTPLYYPSAPGYPPQHMAPPPQPQMPPMGQLQMPQPPQMPQVSQAQMPQAQYRPQLNPRQMPPRQMPPSSTAQGMPMNPRQPVQNQRPPVMRQRQPMIRPRGSVGPTAVRGQRPRMQLNQNAQVRPQVVKRSPEQMQAMQQAKKKRFDVLTPDKDDEDCQVICTQPKNTDGGLPQIQSVQGGTQEHPENSIMHLSDSITLSVRNPQPRPQSPKKSDAKTVANILATRGITVTATPKPKEKADTNPKSPNSVPTSLNLNGAVSIIPSAKPNKNTNGLMKSDALPTVDLTDDTAPAKQNNNVQKPAQRGGLPFKCDLCPAQYPNAIGLSKHRQNYHKTGGGMCEMGVPLINLKQPGIFQKLSSLGIFNYIPLPSAAPDGTYALPIINTRNAGNLAALGATTMLTLGPARNIPRTQPNNGAKQSPTKASN